MIRFISVGFILSLLLACNNSNAPEVSSVTAIKIEKPGKQILVSGATGRQGGAVVNALIDAGYKVRGLSRNPGSERARALAVRGVEMVKGDFNDIASLDAAMKDVAGVFLVTNFWEHGYEAEVQQGKNVVDAVKRAGIKHLVFTSVSNADDATGIPHFDSKYEIEQYILSSNVDYTILRPVSFMENWEYSRDKIIAGKISSPFSLATRVQQISVRDIGRFAALAFSQPENWKGRSLDIAGDEYTMKQVVKLFSQVTGSPVEFVQVSWEDFEKAQGKEMTIMDRWIDGVGYSASINLCRNELPDMFTLEEYIYQAGW
jgi:uncharacterized protein YbjT (DUF2867 family)